MIRNESQPYKDILRRCGAQPDKSPQTNNMTLGERLQKIRTEAGYNQDRMADLCGVSTLAIHNVESDQLVPSISLLLCYCQQAGLSVEQVMGMPTVIPELYNFLTSMSEEEQKHILSIVQEIVKYKTWAVDDASSSPV